MSDLTPDPFADRLELDVLRVTWEDGRVLIGSYMTIAGKHFVTVPQGRGLLDTVEGPLNDDPIVKVEVLRTRAEIVAERYDRRIGERVPGTYRKTRSGYEARLRQIARLIGQTPFGKRRNELEAQFDEVADEIALAKTKRRWIISEAKHHLTSNEPFRKRDLYSGDLYGLAKISRPRDQDFDPDPKLRRARVPVPEHDARDPLSGPNMIKALKRAGFRAGVSVAGEMLDDVADLFVEFPGGKKFGRFALTGTRQADGRMAWKASWHGNYTRADLQRMDRCLRSEAYRAFQGIVAAGLVEAGRQEIAA